MNSESVSGYIFILPFVIGFLVFTVFPMLASLVLSFTDYDMLVNYTIKCNTLGEQKVVHTEPW